MSYEVQPASRVSSAAAQKPAPGGLPVRSAQHRFRLVLQIPDEGLPGVAASVGVVEGAEEFADRVQGGDVPDADPLAGAALRLPLPGDTGGARLSCSRGGGSGRGCGGSGRCGRSGRPGGSGPTGPTAAVGGRPPPYRRACRLRACCLRASARRVPPALRSRVPRRAHRPVPHHRPQWPPWPQQPRGTCRAHQPHEDHQPYEHHPPHGHHHRPQQPRPAPVARTRSPVPPTRRPGRSASPGWGRRVRPG